MDRLNFNAGGYGTMTDSHLLTSVAQGFPIGAIMRLDAGGDLTFKPRPIEGARGVPSPETFLLDGQQRMSKFPGPVDHAEKLPGGIT